MAILSLVNAESNAAIDTPEVFYTAEAEGSGVQVISVTAANNSSVSASYKAYIVDKNGTAVYPQQPFQVVVWGEVDHCQGIVNHTIPPGGSLQFEASSADSIYFTVSGNIL